MINLCLGITKDEAHNMLNDIVKMITMILVVHFLSYSIDNQGTFLDIKIVKLLLYVTISMVIFNLVIKRVINKNDNKSKK